MDHEPTKEPAAPFSIDEIVEWLRAIFQNLDALAPLLPHLLRLFSLWPRFVAIAREAVAEARSEADLEARLDPLTGELLDLARDVGRKLLEQDDLVVRTVEQVVDLAQQAAQRPELARTFEELRDRGLDASDQLLARMVDHAFEASPDPRVGDTVKVLETLINGVVRRTVDSAVAQGFEPASPKKP